MSFSGRVIGAWQVLAGVDAQARDAQGRFVREEARKTAALPSILTQYPRVNGASTMPKPTAANLRRFAEMPVARRAINLVKDRIASMDWQVRVRRGYDATLVESAEERMNALRRALEEPNAADSFRTLWEQVLEDTLVGGFGAVEMKATGDATRPFELYAVDGAAIQVDPKWDGTGEMARYGFVTGRLGTEAVTPLKDDELSQPPCIPVRAQKLSDRLESHLDPPQSERRMRPRVKPQVD